MYDVMGAEVEISFLFADVRRSSEIARAVGHDGVHAPDAALLRDGESRCCSTTTRSSTSSSGDEVVGFFMPFMAGPDHAGAAVRAAQELLRATGHGEADGPVAPARGGCEHRARRSSAWCRAATASEFTAFGDPINVAAHVVAQAGTGGDPRDRRRGERRRSAMSTALERRHLSLKGHQADVVVVPVPARRRSTQAARPAADTALGSRRARSRDVHAGSTRTAAVRSTARARRRARRARRCAARS